MCFLKNVRLLAEIGIFICLVCYLSSCSTGTYYAPVTDITAIERIPKSGAYRVLSGETLYSIAWRYGLDYRYLAKLNHIPPPYHVEAGQLIHLKGKVSSVQKPIVSPTVTKLPTNVIVTQHLPIKQLPRVPVVHHELNTPVKGWRWPAQGPILATYSQLNKGINIGGHTGDPIFATARGQVVYSGNGLRGYGNLIIIKHNATYLTAYAHNSDVFVKEGDWVRAGEKIASMGNTGVRQVMLHFEIRRSGQPVNPLKYLP